MVLYSVAWYCMVLPGIAYAWYCKDIAVVAQKVVIKDRCDLKKWVLVVLGQ